MEPLAPPLRAGPPDGAAVLGDERLESRVHVVSFQHESTPMVDSYGIRLVLDSEAHALLKVDYPRRATHSLRADNSARPSKYRPTFGTLTPTS